MAKAKTGQSGTLRKESKPKRTAQGHSHNSKPYSGKNHRKLSKGQGHG